MPKAFFRFKIKGSNIVEVFSRNARTSVSFGGNIFKDKHRKEKKKPQNKKQKNDTNKQSNELKYTNKNETDTQSNKN